eukprot:6190478-Pleurochrysis_carterae.AAC.2
MKKKRKISWGCATTVPNICLTGYSSVQQLACSSRPPDAEDRQCWASYNGARNPTVCRAQRPAPSAGRHACRSTARKQRLVQVRGAAGAPYAGCS